MSDTTCATLAGAGQSPCGVYTGGSTLGWGPIGPGSASFADYELSGGTIPNYPSGFAGPIAIAGWEWFDLVGLARVIEETSAKFPPGWAFLNRCDPSTLLGRWHRSWAEIVYDVNRRACALVAEFVCDTARETLPSWWADYGIPDACGINNLCAKVGALGGATCTYFRSLGAALGYLNVCCDEVAPEIQTGCWSLGTDPLPPHPDPAGGGCDLGLLCCGYCPPVTGGGPIGTGMAGSGECNVSGYYVDPASASASIVCGPANDCHDWLRPLSGALVCGNRAPFSITGYTGTAYTMRVGLPQPVSIALPSVAITGSWNLGCVPLCVPPRDEVLCFIVTYKPAHVTAVPYHC